MTKQEKVHQLRNDHSVHYNCAQSILIPFAEECGISEETANRMGANFGGGMRVGATCGAITGSLMALGGMGFGEEESKQLLQRFRERHGCLDCVGLLRQAHEKGEDRKAHCDQMIDECLAMVEELSGK